MKNKLWKLAKMLIAFKEYVTEKGKIVISGEVIVGAEVAIETETGELGVAPDGEYDLGDIVITVVEGKVSDMKGKDEPIEEPTNEPEHATEPEPVKEEMEEPVEEPTNEPDEKDLRIQELEGLLADRDAVISELTEKIKQLEEQINKPVEDPVKMSKTIKENTAPKSGALKYFEK